MIDIKIKNKHQKPNADWNMHLGDAILTCTVLATFEKVRVHAKNPANPGMQLLKKLSTKIFSDHYDFELVKEQSNIRYRTIIPDIFYLENNLTTLIPNKNILKTNNTELYITTQVRAAKPRRTITEDQIKLYLPKLKRIELSNARKDKLSLEYIFSLVGNAKKHIGAASGIAWVAMSTKIPTIILLSKKYRPVFNNKWDYPFECMYREPTVSIFDV